MSANTNDRVNRRFKAGWIMLLITATLMFLNHAVLIFALEETVLFVAYTAFSLYALLVVAIPFRRRETWAWYTSWLFPIGLAAAAAVANDPNIELFYYAVAAISMLALLATLPDFFPAGRQLTRHV